MNLPSRPYFRGGYPLAATPARMYDVMILVPRASSGRIHLVATPTSTLPPLVESSNELSLEYWHLASAIGIAFLHFAIHPLHLLIRILSSLTLADPFRHVYHII